MPVPNLDRIPGSEDAEAANTLRRAPRVIDGLFLRTLDRKTVVAVGRYGVRAATLALRQGAPELLRQGLLGTAIYALTRDDHRDVMISLALHFDGAERLGVLPSKLFEDVAGRIADAQVAELLRVFGTRGDVTLESFGWQLVETPSGPDFLPT